LVHTRLVVKPCLFIMFFANSWFECQHLWLFFVMCSDRVTFLLVLTTYGHCHSAVFAEADLHNKFVMATNVLVNCDRGVASLFNSKIMLQ
jgi:hypothetical protein